MFYDYMDSELGVFKISATPAAITAIQKVDKIGQDPNGNDITQACIRELEAYFIGELHDFSTPVDLASGTDFYRKVWREVSLVPYGRTKSYMDIARALDNVGAIRAVGMANGKNPIPIIVPCHRIIGSDGSLTGYSGGLEMKQKLLMIENPQTFGIQNRLF